MEEKAEFGKWRSFFWPIYRSELGKFVPFLLMFSLISFNYNALRIYKDSLIVTAPHSGAEALPFIKVWAILPGAILLTFLFTRLANRYSREKVFYLMFSLFLAFFFLFTFVLLPAQDYLHLNGTSDYLQMHLPAGFKGLLAIFRNWTFTLYYVMSELWATAIMNVLFWGYLNDITTVKEAKRYYGILMIGANIGGIIAGKMSILFAATRFIPSIPYGRNEWEQSMLFLNCVVILSGLLTMGIFRWVHTRVAPASSATAIPPPEKIKMSMRKNFSYLAKSKYLIYIAILVVGYNLTMNLVEVVWKNQMKQVYPNPIDYSAYMGQVMVWMEVLAIICSFIITGNVVRRFSWAFSAFIPLIVAGVTGSIFLIFSILSPETLSPLAAFCGLSPLLLTLTMGSAHNCFTRASKYTFFDTTKEIAFIPLSSESKLKGKAAIDGVGSRIGKSGGSFVHQGLLLFLTTVSASIPYIGIIFVGVLGIWGVAIRRLNKQFEALDSGRMTEADLMAEDQKPILAKEPV